MLAATAAGSSVTVLHLRRENDRRRGGAGDGSRGVERPKKSWGAGDAREGGFDGCDRAMA